MRWKFEEAVDLRSKEILIGENKRDPTAKIAYGVKEKDLLCKRSSKLAYGIQRIRTPASKWKLILTTVPGTFYEHTSYWFYFAFHSGSCTNAFVRYLGKDHCWQDLEA